MSKLTFNTIQAGSEVVILNNGVTEQVTFLGFSDVDAIYGDNDYNYCYQVVFNNLREVKAKYGVKGAKELESLELLHGHKIYAVFHSTGYNWNAYLYNGKWCSGSGADVVRLVSLV